MSAGINTARRVVLRLRVVPVALISLAAGLGPVIPAQAAAHTSSVGSFSGRAPGWQDRLRRQRRRLGNSDPDRDGHQHRRTADPGRPRCHRDHAGRQDRLHRRRPRGHGHADRDGHQYRRTADPGGNRSLLDRDHARAPSLKGPPSPAAPPTCALSGSCGVSAGRPVNRPRSGHATHMTCCRPVHYEGSP